MGLPSELSHTLWGEVMSMPEEICYDGQQQDREDRMRARLEEMGRRGGPDAPDACESCDGKGRIVTEACLCPAPVRDEDCYRECPRCLGTTVQP